MRESDNPSIEAAFASAEAEADAALKKAQTLIAALKKYRAAATLGRVNDLRSAGEAAAGVIQDVDEAVARVANNWDFDTADYLENGAFTAELVATASDAGLRISELDGRLYSYPALLRVQPSDAIVLIDKDRERRIRPSVLVRQLQELQRRPPRFKPDAFLESLSAVYEIAIKIKPGRTPGAVVPLVELYDLLTTKPGDKRDYTRQEFARDIYLLDQSTATTTRSGARLEFHAGAGARLPARELLSVVSQHGRELKYHGVAFVPHARE